MLLASNDLEQTLKLPARTVEILAGLTPDRRPHDNLSSPDAAALREAELLDSNRVLTETGARMLALITHPARRLEACQMHAPQENTITLYEGERETLVWAKIINSRGQNTGDCLLSRTTAENALQHLYAWIKLPQTSVPHETDRRVDCDLLTTRVFSAETRAWKISADIPGQVAQTRATLHIIYDRGYLWEVKDILRDEGSTCMADVEAKDTLSLSMLLHRLWAQGR